MHELNDNSYNLKFKTRAVACKLLVNFLLILIIYILNIYHIQLHKLIDEEKIINNQIKHFGNWKEVRSGHAHAHHAVAKMMQWR